MDGAPTRLRGSYLELGAGGAQSAGVSPNDVCAGHGAGPQRDLIRGRHRRHRQLLAT
jgi:hypothetical protein